MFEQLTERFSDLVRSLRGQRYFSDENTQNALRQVRLSLLEADVALPVIRAFVDTVKSKTEGEQIDTRLNADQAFIKIIHETLVNILGDERAPLQLKAQTPAIILLAGLQGAGKTSTAAKLALHLKNIEQKKVMLVSVDVYRPAAMTQLEQLAKQVDVEYFDANPEDAPLGIATKAIEQAQKQSTDVVIIDTAGRLHIDDAMMAEIKALHQAINPVETLFVVDSMTGQDAANTANAFHTALPLTGVILTKTDGDARGGAALSVKHITGQPIKFMGTGEKVDALEAFHPERVASRILGMGDVLTLIEEVQRKSDKTSQEKLTKKLKKGDFNFNDLAQQLQQMQQMGGGLQGLMSKLPGMGAIQKQAAPMAEGMMKETLAIIQSMTPIERRKPHLIIGSRKRRIANGSGTSIQVVNRAIKNLEKMKKMMKKFSSVSKLKNMMGALGKGDFFPPGI